MAFIFNPNPNEGDKQTNPDTGVEYAYIDGAWRALGAKIEDEFDTLDARYVKLEGTSVVGDLYRLRGPNATGSGQSTFTAIDSGTLKLYNLATPQDSNTAWAAPVGYVQQYVQEKIDAIPDVDLDGYATETYVDDAIAAIPDVDLDGYATEQYVDDAFTNANLSQYFKKTGGTITGSVSFNRGEKSHPQFKITPNAGTTNFATNIYSLGDGDMRFRTSHTDSEEDHLGSHIVLRANGGNPETRIYNVVEAGESTAVPRSYVDNAVANAGGGGVPVGSIMIWMSATPPDGWFKLQGSNFNINTYPQLHAYLQGTSGYTSGKLPNWSGYYPGEYGDHLTHDLGSKQGYKTGQPSAGAPRSSASIPNGNTRTFNATGGTNAYSDGKGKVSINENWDSTTRPKTVVVHYIIKHD